MAYRQLCAVSFAVLGLLAAGCGGTATSATSSSGTTADTGQPPASADQAPVSGDLPPAGGDQAPTQSEPAPTNESQPAGSGGSGQLAALCRQFCSSIASAVDRCSEGMTMLGMDFSCDGADSCQVPANLPCQNEIAGLFNCVIGNLDAICSAGQGNDAASAGVDQCTRALDSFNSCAERNGLDTTDAGNGNGNGNGDQTPVQNCTLAGGCECPTACTSCTCEAGADLNALMACSDSCANP